MYFLKDKQGHDTAHQDYEWSRKDYKVKLPYFFLIHLINNDKDQDRD
jgi:hypothetical protein